MPELRLENSIVDDRYEVDRCLGRGSYAEIFLAYDRSRGGEPVIIKALNTSLQGTPDADLDQTLVENFQNEAIALDKVRHPHIIRRLGHGTAADLGGIPFHYLVLEYMEGGDLLSLCRNQSLTLERTITYFQQVAEALSHAHSQRVIHRDIKPNNLLLTEDHSVVKIADFGVAKMTLDEVTEITRVGTNVYAPPEHHPDAPAGVDEKLTPSADIYSLAKTIYTVMTGRAPRQFSRQPITELPSNFAGEPWKDDLLHVLEKATASRAADRYQTVQEFWQDFARVGKAALPDPEATVVRSRLSEAGTVPKVVARPDFQAIASAPGENYRLQKARIVVDLPQQLKEKQSAVELQPNGKAHTAQGHRAQGQAAPQVQTEAAGRGEVAVREQARATKKIEPVDLDRSYFDDLRVVIGSKWLKFVFILFLVAALIGLAVSIYSHFARGGRSAIPWTAGYREGVVARAPMVNLRSQPGGAVLTALPEGTRIRVLESRDRWTRVQVIEWKGTPPDNVPDSGWLNDSFIQLD